MRRFRGVMNFPSVSNHLFSSLNRQVAFGKMKLDMLSKDRHNVKTDSNFKLGLRMSGKTAKQSFKTGDDALSRS